MRTAHSVPVSHKMIQINLVLLLSALLCVGVGSAMSEDMDMQSVLISSMKQMAGQPSNQPGQTKESMSATAQVQQRLRSLMEYQCASECAVQHRSDWQTIFQGTPLEDMSPVHGDQPGASDASTSGAQNRDMVKKMLWQTADMTADDQLTVRNRTCSAYNDYLDCLSRCHTPEMLEMINSTMGSLRVLCAVSAQDYAEAASCLSELESEYEQTCSGDISALASATARVYQAFQQTAKRTAKFSRTQWAQMIANFCKASVVQSECSLPLIEAKCGAKAAELMSSLLRETVEQSAVLLSNLKVMSSPECRPTNIDVQTAVQKKHAKMSVAEELSGAAGDDMSDGRLNVRSLEGVPVQDAAGSLVPSALLLAAVLVVLLQ